jgi:hypothetical protein
MSFEKDEGHPPTKAKVEVKKDEFQLLIEALSHQIYTQCLQKDLMQAVFEHAKRSFSVFIQRNLQNYNQKQLQNEQEAIDCKALLFVDPSRYA